MTPIVGKDVSMLPGEKEYVERIRQELAQVLTVGQALLELAVDVVAERPPTVSAQVEADNIIAYRVGHAL